VGRLALNSATALVVIFLLGPLLFVVGGSFTTTKFIVFPPQGFTLAWYQNLIRHEDLLEAFGISIIIAAAATAAATTLGTLAAVTLHQTPIVGTEKIRAFVTSPLVLPTVVTGVALFNFSQEVGVGASFAWLIIGHTLITVPYVVRNVGAALMGFDPALPEAAESLGAGWFRIMWSVIVPAVLPAMLVSAMLVFIVSFDQVTVSIFLSTPDTTPLPVRLYSYIEFGLDPMIAAVSTLMILFAYVLVVFVERLFGLNRLFGKG
jgi:putative spermidine/putrescine transport system permease protein